MVHQKLNLRNSKIPRRVPSVSYFQKETNNAYAPPGYPQFLICFRFGAAGGWGVAIGANFMCIFGRFGAFGADYVCIFERFGAFGADFVCISERIVFLDFLFLYACRLLRPFGAGLGGV